MGIFGLGKKKEEQKPVSQQPARTQFTQQDLPELPEFPSLPEEEEEHTSEFPTYEPTVADIKREVSKDSEEELEVPVRNQTFAGKKMVGATFTPSFEFTPAQPQAQQRQAPADRSLGEKPLFVKIDNYKEAMHTLDALKEKLADAEELLRALDDVRSQEEEKLEEWKRDLNNIKEKFASIDRELFEV